MMTNSFTYRSTNATIIFGTGARAGITEQVEKLGHKRALVLSTPQQADGAREIGAALGVLAAGNFTEAAMHTPVEVTERAVVIAKECGADCLVVFGGGSTTGLGKAIALRTGLDQIAIPTTYAGSEVTDILGQTQEGAKTTLRDESVVPKVVIYDPELTVSLPVAISVTSGLNAMAHALEGLYAKDRNPISSMMAAQGIAAFAEALPKIKKAPSDIQARGRALYGAWLCGTVLGTVGMALHHKICHTLGGSFDMPHAETHAVMLPHTIGFNASAVADLLAPAADVLGGSPGAGLYDFALSLDSPLSLEELGFAQSDIDRAAKIASRNPYWNPREISRDAIYQLLIDAYEGRRPAL